MAIRQITIIGTGLIGGSFALALRKRRFAGRIVGCDRESALKRAKMLRRDRQRICRARGRGARESVGGAGDAGSGHRGFDWALGSGIAREHFAYGCGEHEGGGRGAGAERLWKECRTSDFWPGIPWLEKKTAAWIMRMPTCFRMRCGS